MFLTEDKTPLSSLYQVATFLHTLKIHSMHHCSSSTPTFRNIANTFEFPHIIFLLLSSSKPQSFFPSSLSGRPSDSHWAEIQRRKEEERRRKSAQKEKEEENFSFAPLLFAVGRFGAKGKFAWRERKERVVTWCDVTSERKNKNGFFHLFLSSHTHVSVFFIEVFVLCRDFYGKFVQVSPVGGHEIIEMTLWREPYLSHLFFLEKINFRFF